MLFEDKSSDGRVVLRCHIREPSFGRYRDSCRTSEADHLSETKFVHQCALVCTGRNQQRDSPTDPTLIRHPRPTRRSAPLAAPDNKRAKAASSACGNAKGCLMHPDILIANLCATKPLPEGLVRVGQHIREAFVHAVPLQNT